MTRETDALRACVVASGIPHRVTDINTPGVHATTSRHYFTGTPSSPKKPDVSDGSKGLAVDFAGSEREPNGGPQLKAIFDALFERFADHSRELIYSGPDVTHVTFKGKVITIHELPSDVRDAHHNHVHWSVVEGVIVEWIGDPVVAAGLARADSNIEGDDDNTTEEDEDMTNPNWCYRYSDGRYMEIREDGSVFRVGMRHYGNVLDLKPEFRKSWTRPLGIRPIDPQAPDAGYIIASEDGTEYTFNPDTLKKFGK